MLLQKFNDGIASIYKVDNISEAGNMPQDKLVEVHKNIRFAYRTVGFSRFFVAKQAGTRADQLVRIPKIALKGDRLVVIINNDQYEVKQVQYPLDAVPLSIDLTLERLGAEYDFA